MNLSDVLRVNETSRPVKKDQTVSDRRVRRRCGWVVSSPFAFSLVLLSIMVRPDLVSSSCLRNEVEFIGGFYDDVSLGFDAVDS